MATNDDKAQQSKMPNIGDVKQARELNRKGHALFVYDSCSSCDSPRWVYLSKKGGLCNKCAAQSRARRMFPITYTSQGEPEIGDTATAKSLGYASNGIMKFSACVKCGNGHWVNRRTKDSACVHCGRREEKRNKKGYIYVHLDKNDPFYAMADHGGGVLEHRIITARKIGRVLRSNEVVHHINGIKHDNRPENLQLLAQQDHNSYLTIKDLQQRVLDLESRVVILEADNALLNSQLNTKLIPYQAEE